MEFFQKLITENQFFTGGFVLGVFTFFIGLIYKLPAFFNWLFSKLSRGIHIGASEYSHNKEALSMICAWLIKNVDINKHDLSITSKKNSIPFGKYYVNLEAGTYSRYFFKDWRLWWYSRDIQKETATLYHNISLRVFPCSKAYMEDVVRNIFQKDGKQHLVYRQTTKESFTTFERHIKSFDQVFYNNGIKEIVCQDLARFRDRKSFYRSHGLRYKRGYLFYGPPGTGKTSMAEAIAYEADKDLLCVNLSSDDLDDNTLGSTIAEMAQGKVVLIEDVDCLFKNRNTTSSTVTFSGFLNFIDGVNSPEDTIFVITTNHIDQLDKALMRTGRVDCCFEIANPTEETVAAYLHWYYGVDLDIEAGIFASRNMSMSDIQNICLGCLTSEDLVFTASLMENMPVMEIVDVV